MIHESLNILHRRKEGMISIIVRINCIEICLNENSMDAFLNLGIKIPFQYTRYLLHLHEVVFFNRQYIIVSTVAGLYDMGAT